MVLIHAGNEPLILEQIHDKPRHHNPVAHRMPVKHASVGQEIFHSQQRLEGSSRRKLQRFDPPGSEARVIGRLIDADETRQPIAGPGIMPVTGKFEFDGSRLPECFDVELSGFHQRAGEPIRCCRERMRRYCRFPVVGDDVGRIMTGICRPPGMICAIILIRIRRHRFGAKPFNRLRPQVK